LVGTVDHVPSTYTAIAEWLAYPLSYPNEWMGRLKIIASIHQELMFSC